MALRHYLFPRNTNIDCRCHGENNWVRRIAGVKRVDRRRMDELREEVGIQKCLMGRLVKSRMKWAGHVERIKDDRLPRMAYMFTRRGEREREEDHV